MTVRTCDLSITRQLQLIIERDLMLIVFRRCQFETRRQFLITDRRFLRLHGTSFFTTPASRRIGIGWYSSLPSTLLLWSHTTLRSK